jgi:glycosyltransferase involved in cell wall biosynthesis
MKILYLIKAFALKAGLERVICDKMNWLAENGYEVMLVTYEQGNHPFSYPLHQSIVHKDLNVRFFELANYSLINRVWHLLSYRSRFKKSFRQIVDDFCPDVIITTTYQMKLVDIILSVKSDSTKIIESHVACYTVIKETDFENHFFIKKIAKIYDAYFLGKLSKFKKLIVLTKGDAEDWRKYVDNIDIIPNPITFFPSNQLIDNSEHHRIIAVGRLHEQKGFDFLINAFSKIADKCPEWHIDIFGDGEDEQLLREQLEKSGLTDRIFFHHPTPDIYDEYLKSDFYVLSSRYEGFPLVLNEAMSCGIPCVAFRCKYGPEDAITDNANGLLVKNGDVDSLAEAILWMIQHPDDRRRMGRAARTAAARYQKDEIMSKWVSLFDSLVSP